ncbi:DEAD/DEAH box helicase [Chitinophaga defluvii]|uniref:AAA domain-containing protein n=1 Tax=Chitinophaga defluvii TaxID=3163343 RepID=A0ABV2T8I5_9BACT
MSKTHIGDAFFMRIQEAHQASDPLTAIRSIQLILENLFRALTAGELRGFGNLFARMQFYFDKYQVATEIREQLSVLRILTSKAANREIILTTEQYLLCIKTLSLAVHHFYALQVPDALATLYTAVMNKQLTRPVFHHPELVPVLKCLVMNTGPLESDVNGKHHFMIQCKNEELGTFHLQLTETSQPHLIALHPQLRPYDTIHILHCRKTGEEQHYTTVPESQIILEPDLLIDISDLAECFGHRGVNPLLYLVKKLVPQQYNEAAFKGNLVNALLDAVLRNREMDFKTSFVEAVSENVLQAAACGREKLNEMFHEIRTRHWANLQKASAELENRPVRIEPTFFSSRYGLQGRLDILAEDQHDPNRKEIFELKSGRAPDFNTWKNHEMQVIGYNLLLKSAFGPERTGSSAILYSVAANTPLRNVTSTSLGENNLLTLRNEVVSQLLRLAAEDYTILDTITGQAAEGLPSFSARNFTWFQQVYQTANPVFREYYQHYLSFVLRELLLAKCGMYAEVNREDDANGFAALWLQQENEKQAHFNIINGLRFDEFDTETSTVVCTISHPINHNFRIGDTAIIYPRSADGLAPLQHQLLKGRIDDLKKDRLVFSLNNRQITHDFFTQYEEWVVEHDIYESNYWASTTALFHMLDPLNATRMELLLGQRAPVAAPLRQPAPAMYTPNQENILRAALEAQDYYLIQGPPGTGKTSSLLTALVAAIVQQHTQVVIVAFTNRAVDEICKKLEDKGITHLRMGSRRAASEVKLRQYCLNGEIAQARQFISQQRVFVATVATMAVRLQLLAMLGVHLHTLIVDEASQLTEPQLLGMLVPFKKFVLIGDQNQLPPVVAQQEHFCQVKAAPLQELGITDLRCSIFERLMLRCKANGWHHAWGMLSTHFRMHDEIAALVNHFYAGQLASGTSQQQLPFLNKLTTGSDEAGWEGILSQGRKLFIPSPREATSKMNRTEAQWVVSLLHFLKDKYGHRFTPSLVGVVTPWRTQISLIRELIGDDPVLQQVNIDTVERFQGSENDIIIVSLAIYHPAQLSTLECVGHFNWQAANIEVDRKLLVTLSRAKEQVILMGYEPVLKSSKHYTSVLAGMRKITKAILGGMAVGQEHQI